MLQTALSMGVMLVYIPALFKLQPYKLPSDNHVAVLDNWALFFVLFAGLLLKVESSFASTGRFEPGYSSETLGYFLSALCVVVLAAWCVSLWHDICAFNAKQCFRYKHDNTLVTMPILTPPDERYHIFISHSQQDGGDQVGHIKKELEKYVETINIFTDVAAGRVERALSAKTELYTAIERSSVFLVFLSKTYFTRKWCVKEFQEAIATGKHIVIVLDTDTRHGGMSLDAFVEYSTGQRARADADKAAGASNLWNQGRGGDTECQELCNWVAEHLHMESAGRAAAPQKLCIRAFTYPSTNGPGDPVPERCYSVIPWYRYAEFKQVSLQIMMEQFLEVPEWDLPAKRRSLKLRVPRVKLTPSRGHHVCLSAFDSASPAIKRKLEGFIPNINVSLAEPGQPFTEEHLSAATSVLVVNRGFVAFNEGDRATDLASRESPHFL